MLLLPSVGFAYLGLLVELVAWSDVPPRQLLCEALAPYAQHQHAQRLQDHQRVVQHDSELQGYDCPLFALCGQ